MKVISVCPQPIYTFQIDPTLASQVQNLLPSERWKANASPTSTTDEYSLPHGAVSIMNFATDDSFLHRSPIYKSLTDWFLDCVNRVKSEYSYMCERLSITQMWGNKAMNGNYHHNHMHPFSILSGIYYVNNSQANTLFRFTDHFNICQYPLHLSAQTREIIHKEPSEKGKLLIFPSQMYHSVDKHHSSVENRYTISFNTLPSGSVGDPLYLAGADIEIK